MLERLLGEARFRTNAGRIGRDIAASGGAARAADIVEDAVLGRSVRIAGSGSEGSDRHRQ